MIPQLRSSIHRRYIVVIAVLVLAFALLWLVWPVHRSALPESGSTTSSSPASSSPAGDASGPTTIYAHNLLLRKGPQFRIYIRWISGQLLRTNRNVAPTFDNADSFVLLIQKGVIHANLGDIGNFLNSGSFPLKNMTVRGEGDQVRLTGIMHKLLVPLPVELLSTVSATPDGRIHLHVNKIDVLKIPVKGLLGGLHVEINGIVGSSPMSGVEVSGNDIFLNTTQLLPPPHIHGLLTSVTVASPDLVLIYGNAINDDSKLAQWHNFLRFNGGTLGFGKLSMHPADLTLIDASDDAWFDLDLVNYQAQLTNAYSRMTSDGGFEIFMPELDQLQHQKTTASSVTLNWLKNRSQPMPADVHVK